MKYVLYNPRANNGQKPDFLMNVNYIEVIGLDYQAFFDRLLPQDEVTLVGGDGTLNYFVNAVDTDNLKNNVYLEPAGTGNDFMNDIDNKKGYKVLMNEYIKHLPTIFVNGIQKKFINGIGYGIDGYCCEVADKIKVCQPGKQINYTSIALKGLLKDFRPRKATVIVDGKTYSFENVWLAPAMKGRFFGGGMQIAPNQNRKKDTLSTVICYTKSRFKMLKTFPSVFNGNHIKHTEMVRTIVGKEIEVIFDEPCALQIDGDTVLDVYSYKVKA